MAWRAADFVAVRRVVRRAYNAARAVDLKTGALVAVTVRPDDDRDATRRRSEHDAGRT